MPWVLIAWLTGCGSEPPRPVSLPRSPEQLETPEENPAERDVKEQHPSPTPVEALLARAGNVRLLPYGSTLHSARGDLLMGYVPETFAKVVIQPGAEHFVLVRSDVMDEPRGVVVEWDGSEPLLVELLEYDGTPVAWGKMPRSTRRITPTRVELLSNDLGNYFVVHVRNPGKTRVTYEALVHMSIVRDH